MSLKYTSFKLLIILFIICSLAISCTEIEETANESDSAASNVLRLDVPAPFTSLNPTTDESGSILVFHFLFDSLFSKDEKGEFVPELATSFSYDQKDLAWTIYLRKGPKFHNGRPIEAKDVAYSLRERLRNLRSELYHSIRQIAPMPDGSVRILLKRDNPQFLSKIYHSEIIPEPAGEAEDYYNHPVGSGPFKFEYRKGQREVSLVVNEDYYKGRASLDRIQFDYEADSEKSWARLINGSTDAAFEIHPLDYEMLKDHEDLFYLNAKLHGLYAILLYNTHDPTFSDQRVRLALSLAIDKETIIRNIIGKYGEIAVGPVAADSPYFNPDLKPMPYDPQRSANLLKQAGWVYDEKGRYLQKQGAPFEFTILYPEKDRILKHVTEYVQLYLNDIGIRTDLTPIPIDEMMRRYIGNTDFQAVLTELGNTCIDLQMLRQYWSSLVGFEASGAGCFENLELARIFDEGTKESNPERIKELFQQAQALIVSLQPGTFLFHRKTLDVLSKRIEFSPPFSMHPSALYRLRSASVRNHVKSGK